MKTYIDTSSCFKKFSIVCRHDNGELISASSGYFQGYQWDDIQGFIDKCKEIDDNFKSKNQKGDKNENR